MIMIPKYGDRATLWYNDTDSGVYHIVVDDFYTDISPDLDRWFNMSNCFPSIDRPLHIGQNKKVVGKMKDEPGGDIITDFVALRSKSYA